MVLYFFFLKKVGQRGRMDSQPDNPSTGIEGRAPSSCGVSRGRRNHRYSRCELCVYAVYAIPRYSTRTHVPAFCWRATHNFMAWQSVSTNPVNASYESHMLSAKRPAGSWRVSDRMAQPVCPRQTPPPRQAGLHSTCPSQAVVAIRWVVDQAGTLSQFSIVCLSVPEKRAF